MPAINLQNPINEGEKIFELGTLQGNNETLSKELRDFFTKRAAHSFA